MVLAESKVKRLSLVNHTTKKINNSSVHVVEKPFPDSIVKAENWAYLWINNLKFYSLFLMYVMLGAIKIYWN